MTYTNEDTANHFLNLSLQNKLSASLKSYIKAYAATIPATHHDYQNPSRRLLLADHGGRLPQFCQKMHTLAETWQHHPPKTGTTSFYTIPVVLCKVGNGHSRPFLPEQRPSKVSDSSRRLLHQMDRSQTISHYHSPTSSAIRLEGYYMSVWRRAYNHH